MDGQFILANKARIAKTVIMPGDPQRVEYIAKHYLDDAVCVNENCTMLGYTGTYKGKQVTVIASGMGIPSIAACAYELYNYYDVETIIRVGTCGKYSTALSIGDVINVCEAYSDSSFALAAYNESSNYCKASKQVFDILNNIAQFNLATGSIYTSDVFYRNKDAISNQRLIDLGLIAAENEAFGLFVVAKHLHKKAGCLLTVFGSCVSKETASMEVRQSGLDNMIRLALDAA